jgi:uncharacterized protein (UPF0335 family)
MSNVESTVTPVGAPAPQQSPPTIGDNVSKNAAAQLRSIVQLVEELEANKKEIADDIGDVYTKAKGNGYDLKALRTIVRMRKMDAKNPTDQQEQEAILDTYLQAMGMI